MKILISGSSGFVGSRVLHQWQGRAELFTFPRGSLAAADESAIRRFVEAVQPDVILHLAALSDTGYCQIENANIQEFALMLISLIVLIAES